MAQQTLRAFPLFVLFWAVLSGHFEPLFLGLGAASIVIVCWISWRTGIDTHTSAVTVRLPRYLPWLTKEVIVSSIAVVRKVWSPRPELRPAVEPVPSPGMSELTQVIYANSITLTPGTLSMQVGDDDIQVHALEPAGIEQLHEGQMLRRVQRLEPRR